MRYVGYSRGFHDGGLAIIEEDGTVSYASNSERYTKIKYDPMLAPELESMIRNDDYVVYFQDLQKNAKKWEWSPMTIHRSFCLLYTSPSPRDRIASRMPSSA